MTEDQTPVPDDDEGLADSGDVELTGVVVAVDADHMATMDDVVDELRHVGLVVEHTMEALGTVSGRISPERLDSIAAVPGVSAVERSSTIQLPPPESEIQ